MAADAKPRNTVIETIKTIVYALIIAGIFRTVFFQPFWIPSGSMKDTLLIGDFLFVNKMAYGYSYASCPSVRIQRLGIDIDAADICGFLDGDSGWASTSTRPISAAFLTAITPASWAENPNAATSSCSAIRYRGRISSSG